MMEQNDATVLADAFNLRVDAQEVIDDLNLEELIAPYGELIAIGSCAAALMVVRDIDFGVLCSRLDPAPIFAITQRLFTHPRVRKVQVSDERPPFQSMDGPENEGIYCGIRYCEDGSRDLEWKIDLWFFPADAPRPEIPMRDRLLAASDEERVAILQLKGFFLRQGVYGSTVAGIDIYRAVLDRGNHSLLDVVRSMAAAHVLAEADEDG